MKERITNLEAAKALRIICAHARQLGMLIRYLMAYMGGDPTPRVDKYAHNRMLDLLASEYGIRLAAVIRTQVDFYLQEQFGWHLTMDEMPDSLRVCQLEEESLQEMVDGLSQIKREFMTLKDRVLYVALKRGELKAGNIGVDDGVCWQSVSWRKRGFLVPASAEQAVWCRETGAPEMSPVLTGTVPIQVRHRQEATIAQILLKTFLEQNRSYLVGFDVWMQDRDPEFLRSERLMN